MRMVHNRPVGSFLKMGCGFCTRSVRSNFLYRSAASVESRASPEKAGGGGGGGGGNPTCLFSFSNVGQFSRHGVGVSLYVTNLYNKHTSNNNKITSKRGVWSHPSPPPPPLTMGLCIIITKLK